MVFPTKINVLVPEILYKTRSIVHKSTAKDSYNDSTCMQVMFGHVYIVSLVTARRGILNVCHWRYPVFASHTQTQNRIVRLIALQCYYNH